MARREDDQPMRLAGAHSAVRRIWTVELRPGTGGLSLVCAHCNPRIPALEASSARTAALEHLAGHARRGVLPGHLRTCQCQERGCIWHPRRRGCAGPVLLALTRDRSARTWRLADTCAACAAATTNTAVVPDTLIGARQSAAPRRAAAPRSHHDEHRRVREMLTYLAAALPQITSPAARLLAVQCSLRCDAQGRVRLPAGLLRGMRLYQRGELWEELADAAWLRLPGSRPPHNEAWLRDAAVLDQAPGRSARRRAAHWALRPTPLLWPTAAPPALRLAALALAVHGVAPARDQADMDTLSRLCGHSPHQLGELFDRLLVTNTLSACYYNRESGVVRWQLPLHLGQE
ncbi:hypothetical protein [Streptomyces tropicalis]|uniref:Uncharacterized protein n=1 Tax=Streptomyces tropicalis TaxID=3034234 RepID=A0ABT6A607_9ACTN|nr:hypothetical protein [Streptomyces tropicalis]MDF3300070.1 hypothetical protein [Streptomyces tropicalis]